MVTFLGPGDNDTTEAMWTRKHKTGKHLAYNNSNLLKDPLKEPFAGKAV